MDRLIINTKRTSYGKEDIKGTLTVSQLREILDQYEDNAQVILSFDGGYTYGGITENSIELDEHDDTDARVEAHQGLLEIYEHQGGHITREDAVIFLAGYGFEDEVDEFLDTIVG